MSYVTILTDTLSVIQLAIAREDRLSELVDIQLLSGSNLDDATILVQEGTILQPVLWDEMLPPVLLPQPLIFTPENLLAIVFMQLGNWEKAYTYAQSDAALTDSIDLTNRLQSGVPMEAPPTPINDIGTFSVYQRWHNRAIVLHYGHLASEVSAYSVDQAYQAAFFHSPSALYQSYTSKHYAIYLLDNGQLDKANQVLAASLNEIQEFPQARTELLAVQYGVWLQQLTVPYDAILLEKTKNALWEVLQAYEAAGKTVQTGMLLVDATQVATFQNSFSEALGYVNRAIAIFLDEQIPELVANAQYRKGVLLYTWAQHGNRQFYRPAMEAYQEALKVFTQQNAPAIFAEIQHHLGVIYSEIPDEVKKKSIWAAISSNSFQQALAYFTKDTFPYEYAAICNHYANALTKYPPSAKTDNYAKAITYYREALRIRTAEVYPYERTLTILNYLEAGWYVGEDDPFTQRSLYDDLLKKAREVEHLVTDVSLIQEAHQHLAQLIRLQPHLQP